MHTPVPAINDEIFSYVCESQASDEGVNLVYKDITGLWIIQQCIEKWRKDFGK